MPFLKSSSPFLFPSRVMCIQKLIYGIVATNAREENSACFLYWFWSWLGPSEQQ